MSKHSTAQHNKLRTFKFKQTIIVSTEKSVTEIIVGVGGAGGGEGGEEGGIRKGSTSDVYFLLDFRCGFVWCWWWWWVVVFCCVCVFLGQATASLLAREDVHDQQKAHKTPVFKK